MPNITTDKHDLFRTIEPGYIFMLCFMSFVLVNSEACGKLGFIFVGRGLSESLILLAAGYPVGVVMQAIYWYYWHLKTYKENEKALINASPMQTSMIHGLGANVIAILFSWIGGVVLFCVCDPQLSSLQIFPTVLLLAFWIFVANAMRGQRARRIADLYGKRHEPLRNKHPRWIL